MGNNCFSAAKTIASIMGMAGDEFAAIMNLADPKNHPSPKKHLDNNNKLALASGGASAVKTAVGMLELGGKRVPYIGGFLSSITLSCTVKKIYNDLKNPNKGTVDLTDVISVIGDIAGIVSLIAVFAAGVVAAVYSAPVVAAIVAGLGILATGLSLISAGLSLITLHPSLQNYIIDTDRLSKFFDLHKSPRSFDNVKYIDLDAYLKLPGSSLELIMELQKGNLRYKAYSSRRPLAFKPDNGSKHSHRHKSHTHKKKTLLIDHR